MRRAREATLVVASVALLGVGFAVPPQRGVLPFGLKAGHHAVQTGTPGPHGLIFWTPRDSGGFPVVLLTGDRPAALDSVWPVYLASHGFRVARVRGPGVAAAARVFGGSTPVAVVEWGRDTDATALLESANPVSIRIVRPGDSLRERLRVDLPPPGTRPDAAARRYRLLCAVTQAILNATLTSGAPTLPQLAARLRAAGLQGTYIRAS